MREGELLPVEGLCTGLTALPWLGEAINAWRCALRVSPASQWPEMWPPRAPACSPTCPASPPKETPWQMVAALDGSDGEANWLWWILLCLLPCFQADSGCLLA